MEFKSAAKLLAEGRIFEEIRMRQKMKNFLQLQHLSESLKFIIL